MRRHPYEVRRQAGAPVTEGDRRGTLSRWRRDRSTSTSPRWCGPRPAGSVPPPGSPISRACWLRLEEEWSFRAGRPFPDATEARGGGTRPRWATESLAHVKLVVPPGRWWCPPRGRRPGGWATGSRASPPMAWPRHSTRTDGALLVARVDVVAPWAGPAAASARRWRRAWSGCSASTWPRRVAAPPPRAGLRPPDRGREGPVAGRSHHRHVGGPRRIALGPRRRWADASPSRLMQSAARAPSAGP